MENKKTKKDLVVAVSGYFDPLHIGHLQLFKLAKNLVGENGRLIAIINNDNQAKLKKGKPFMPQNERIEIIKALKLVDEVVLSIDEDRTVSKTLEMVKPDIFACSFRKHDRIPEQEVCERFNIKIVDSLGEKLQSSSTLTGLMPIEIKESK
ncbi:adenylyltransferase/cytidyltransferase family protein [Candidatus Pacearchaeota archaeon]|nr:adenylyltransferase/cytidyltransferase family protein [Candidatus Pacearchaeota archaeon]